MTDTTATPETGTVDAPASMESIIAEIGTGETPADAADEVVQELVEQTEEGDAEEAADEGEAADAGENGVDEAPAPESDDASEPTYKVTVNGEEADVPLSELLKGYSREADYTKKTQALAEEKRGIEARLTSEYADQLKQATDLFVQLDPVLAQADQIDWQALAQDDPATYTQLHAAYDARVQAVNGARAEIQRASQAQQQAAQEQQQQGLQETEKVLRSVSPDFADDTKFAAFVTETVSDLRGAGLDGDDVMAVMSNPQAGPQIASLLADARKWRAQEKAKAGLPAKKVVTVSAAKPLKADASTGSQPSRRMPRNANSGDRAAFVVNELLSEG